MASEESRLSSAAARFLQHTANPPQFSPVRIRPADSYAPPSFRELWQYRELLYFLTWRDVKVRYKQSAIGVAWAVFQPLMTMLIFTVVFQNFATMPSDGVPYSLFSFSGLLLWNLFSGALTRCITSIVGQANLISKVYFPRLMVPISATIVGLVDFGVAFVFLLVLMLRYGIFPTWAALTVPVFIVLTLLASIAVGLWLAALNVRFRDVGHVMPLLIQLWLFVCPIAYPISRVPERWRLLYSLNPMAGIITGFRWALLGTPPPEPLPLIISTAALLVVLVGGVLYFTRMERTFADVV